MYMQIQKTIKLHYLYLKKQSYTQAYKAFSKLVENDYASIDYSFYLARTATILNKPDEAITAYERILILKPDHTKSKIELGKLYFNQGDFTQAETYFHAAQADTVTEAVSNDINTYLAKIESTKKKSSLDGTLIFGIGYDSNVNVSPEASSWFVPSNNQNFNNASNQVENVYNQQVGIVNHYYDATSKYGFVIKNSLLGLNKSIPGESDYNIQYLRYKPALIFKYKAYKIETALQYDTMRYGGDAYLETYGFAPKISRELSPSSLISVQAKLFVKNYLQQTDQALDAQYSELGLNYYKQFTPTTTWHAGVDIMQERADKNGTLDVSNNMALLTAGLIHQYSASVRLGAQLQYSNKNYLDNNPFFLSKREDNYLRASVDISKDLNKDLSLQLRTSYVDNKSNQDAYSYNKNVFLLNLIKRF
ncbi:hypothetical protein JCM30760_00260 [Thiomicrorhabdus hydrogeniphila]